MRNALLMTALMLGFSLAHAEAPAEPELAPEPDTLASKTAETKPDLRAERHCIRDTGTRMKARDKDGCVANAPGRSYGHDDIERTGQTDIARALPLLDPSISRGN
ncbi:MAG: hypothetical protein CVV14_02240 [Gammaproteobacteria bacterium HGW-Gammaproteobacteria-4]|jgi:hypothetical protein|nr:MAG: hypothetical protein CVV14_02240 [Gammaproteobacteria bacterium HGW-Gammaproteobacteria-4]